MKIINRLRSLFRHLRKITLSLLGIKLLDPIQVFYLSDQAIVYPINAKGGNSSLKLSLIRQYNPTYVSKFPEIHNINPADLTEGVLERIRFNNYRSYLEFCVGKEIRLVIRNPYDRFYSCFLGIDSERNIMYHYPAQIHNLIRIRKGITWKKLLVLIALIPDRIADKHFRSQSFYLVQGLTTKAKEVHVFEMKQHLKWLSSGKPSVEAGGVIRLNNSQQSIPSEVQEYLSGSRLFQWRYRADLERYHEIVPQPPYTS